MILRTTARAFHFVMLNADLALKALYEQGMLQQWKSLHMLCGLVLLACPNNMNTESGFSRMKFAETTYQSNFNCETYDSIRIIQEVFDRESFESCEFAEELYASIENASSNYKKITKDTVVENSKKRSIAEPLREVLLETGEREERRSC